MYKSEEKKKRLLGLEKILPILLTTVVPSILVPERMVQSKGVVKKEMKNKRNNIRSKGSNSPPWGRGGGYSFAFCLSHLANDHEL